MRAIIRLRPGTGAPPGLRSRRGRGAAMLRWAYRAAPPAALLLATACREAPVPITSIERTPAPLAYPLQLTYSVRDDRTPHWSADGDSVYYVIATGVTSDMPTTSARVLPSGAGFAAPALEPLEAALPKPTLIFEPTFSPGGDRFAFAQVIQYHQSMIAQTEPGCLGDAAARQNANRSPRLGRLAVHIRAVAGGSAQLVELALPGRSFASADTIVVDYHPFQRMWDETRAIPFHLSWSPDGTRLATSNGVGVVLIDAVTGVVEQVPGSTDGVAPSWSPDGQRIAFTRLPRGTSATAFCIHPGFLTPIAYQRRRVYAPAEPRLVVLELATGAVTELGVAQEPVWSGDGRYVYAVRDNAIWRIDVNGGGATIVDGTENGREPALSPDATLLAFSKLGPRGDYDIWIAHVPQ